MALRFGQKRKIDPLVLSRARDATAAALTAAGVEPREDPDRRKVWPVVCDFPGVRIRWTATPRKGYITYRVTDDETGKLVMVGTPKAIYAEVARRMPEVRRPPRKDPQHYSARDEQDAAAHTEAA